METGEIMIFVGRDFVVMVRHGEHSGLAEVALQLRPLVGMHRVLDGEFVQTEDVGHRLHLVVVGFVQADPHEALLAVLL